MAITLKGSTGNRLGGVNDAPNQPVRYDVTATVPSTGTQLTTVSLTAIGNAATVNVPAATSNPANAIQIGSANQFGALQINGQQSVILESIAGIAPPSIRLPDPGTNPMPSPVLPTIPPSGGTPDLPSPGMLPSLPNGGGNNAGAPTLPGSAALTGGGVLIQGANRVRDAIEQPSALPDPIYGINAQAAYDALPADVRKGFEGKIPNGLGFTGFIPTSKIDLSTLSNLPLNVPASTKETTNYARTLDEALNGGYQDVRSTIPTVLEVPRLSDQQFPSAPALPLPDRLPNTFSDLAVDYERAALRLNKNSAKAVDGLNAAEGGLGSEADRVASIKTSGPVATNKSGSITEDGDLLAGSETIRLITSEEDPRTASQAGQLRVDSVRLKGDTGTGQTVARQTTADEQVTAIKGKYGTLYVGSDGSVKYDLDESKVQFLKNGKSLDETFEYRLVDGYGKKSSVNGEQEWANLTYTIEGRNDRAFFTVDRIDGRTAKGAEFANDGTVAAQGISPTGDVTQVGMTVRDVDSNETDKFQYSVSSVFAQHAFEFKQVSRTSDAEESTRTKNPTRIDGKFGFLLIGTDGTYKYTVDTSKVAYQNLAKDVVDFESFQIFLDETGESGRSTESRQYSVPLSFKVVGVNDRPDTSNIIRQTAGNAESESLRGSLFLNQSQTHADADGTGDKLTLSNIKLSSGIKQLANGMVQDITSFELGKEYVLVDSNGAFIGRLTINGNSNYVFDAANPSGSTAVNANVVIDYTLTDAAGLSSTSKLTINKIGAQAPAQASLILSRGSDGFFTRDTNGDDLPDASANGLNQFRSIKAITDPNAALVNGKKVVVEGMAGNYLVKLDDGQTKTVIGRIELDNNGSSLPDANWRFIPLGEFVGDVSFKIAYLIDPANGIYTTAQSVTLANRPVLMDLSNREHFVDGGVSQGLFGSKVRLLDKNIATIEKITVSLANGEVDAALPGSLSSKYTVTKAADKHSVSIQIKSGNTFSDADIDDIFAAISGKAASAGGSIDALSVTINRLGTTQAETVLLQTQKSLSNPNIDLSSKDVFIKYAVVEKGLALVESDVADALDLNGDRAGRSNNAQTADQAPVAFVSGGQTPWLSNSSKPIDRIEISFDASDSELANGNLSKETEFIALGSGATARKIELHFFNDQAVADFTISGVKFSFICRFDDVTGLRTLVVSKSQDQGGLLTSEDLNLLLNNLHYVGRPSAKDITDREFSVQTFYDAETPAAAPAQFTVSFVSTVQERFAPIATGLARFNDSDSAFTVTRPYDDNDNQLKLSLNERVIEDARILDTDKPNFSLSESDVHLSAQETAAEGILQLFDGLDYSSAIGIVGLGTNADDDITLSEYLTTVKAEGNDTSTVQTAGGAMYGFDGNDKLTGNSGEDTLVGGNGDDTLNGADGNDVLNGESGDDKLLGGQGNDTLRSGEGDDQLDGGDGIDVVVLNGTRAEYQIELVKADPDVAGSRDHWIFTRGASQTTIYDVEVARFDDGLINLDTSGSEDASVIIARRIGASLDDQITFIRYGSVSEATANLQKGDTILLGAGNHDKFAITQANLTIHGLGQDKNGNWLTLVNTENTSGDGILATGDAASSSLTIGGARGFGLEVWGSKADGDAEHAAIHVKEGRPSVEFSDRFVLGFNHLVARGEHALRTNTVGVDFRIEGNLIDGETFTVGENARAPADGSDKPFRRTGNNEGRQLVFIGQGSGSATAIPLLEFLNNIIAGEAGAKDQDISPINDLISTDYAVKLYAAVVKIFGNEFLTSLPGPSETTYQARHLFVAAADPQQSQISNNRFKGFDQTENITGSSFNYGGIEVKVDTSSATPDSQYLDNMLQGNMFTGSDGADYVVSMTAGADEVDAGAGADTINASAGNDVIRLGNDTDADVLQLIGASGTDALEQFRAANDKLMITDTYDQSLGVDAFTTENDPGFSDSNGIEVYDAVDANTIDTRRDTAESVQGLQKGQHATADVIVMSDNSMSSMVIGTDGVTFKPEGLQSLQNLFGSVNMDKGDKFLTVVNFDEAGFAVVEVTAQRFIEGKALDFDNSDGSVNASARILALQTESAGGDINGGHLILDSIQSSLNNA